MTGEPGDNSIARPAAGRSIHTAAAGAGLVLALLVHGAAAPAACVATGATARAALFHAMAQQQRTVPLLLALCGALLLCSSSASGLDHCVGEFSLCPDGSCALVKSSCGRCQPSQYACPLDRTCLHKVEDYATICQGLAGTHLDTNLSPEARLDKLVDAVAQNLTELTRQLVNNAPAIDRLSLPAYNYLNDDEHGVIGTASATVFPMGVGMGASWSSETVHLVGTAIGVEARSTHNVLTDKSGNSCGSTSTGQKTANGCGAENSLLEPFGTETPSICQDRLGTDTAKAEKTGGFCCRHHALRSEHQPRPRSALGTGGRGLWRVPTPHVRAGAENAFFCAPLYTTENDHFAKTGSGQTREETLKQETLSAGGVHRDWHAGE
jgi:hypothetical protein